MNSLALHRFTRHIETLKQRLSAMLWHHYEKQSPLQSAFCALVLQLDKNCKVRKLYDALPYRSNWMNMVELQNTLAHLGYDCSCIYTTAEKIDNRLLPCVFISELDHFEHPENPYVILEINDETGCLTVFDCHQERASFISFEEAASWGRGNAYTFHPLQEDQKQTSQFIRAGTQFSWFRALLTRFNGIARQVLFTGLCLNLISLSIPIFIMLVYDRVITAQAQETLFYLIPGVLLALGFEWFLRYLRGQNLSWLAARLDNIVGNTIFAHLIQLPPNYIEQASVSSQISRIRSFEYVRDFFSGPVFLSVLELPFVLLTLAIIMAIAGPLVLVPLVMAGAYLGLFFIMRRYIKVLIRTAAKASSMRQQFTMETLEKIEDIRIYGLDNAWQKKFRQLSGREYLAHFRLKQFGVTSETLAHALTIISAVAILGFGVGRIWSGAMTVGALVATMILVWRVLTPLYSLCSMIPRLEQLSNAIRQINQLMDIETEASEGKRKARLKTIKGEVCFQNVELRYADDIDPVFTGLTFKNSPGMVTMIYAPSGSGKTTVLKLIQGMYKPSKGSIRLDGFDIRQIDPVDIRRQIGYVPQHPDFFHGTIAENLRLVKPTAKESEMWEALRMTGAYEAVQAMPDKLETIIAKPGDKLMPTSLQFQFSLARSYLQNTPLLLIDEQPMVVMNSAAGKRLEDYIKKSRGKRSIVMVTSRKEMLKLADNVVFLNTQHKQKISLKEQGAQGGGNHVPSL